MFGQPHTLLERHSRGRDKPQRIELECEVTKGDLSNIAAMQNAATTLPKKIEDRFTGVLIRNAVNWEPSLLTAGQRLTFKLVGDELAKTNEPANELYHQYLIFYEAYNRLLTEMQGLPLSIPMMSMPVNRSSAGFQSSVSLANYNDADYKKSVDAATSRNVGQILTLAIGRIATKFRLLLETDAGGAAHKFYEDPQIKLITSTLKALGYDWTLASPDPLTNLYDIRLEKQGSSFLMGSASSGEKELLTYLFAVYGLNLRDALIVIDEPELHLHPRWQGMLLDLFDRLTKDTNNQFLLATHSPVFVSPSSIQYVSRLYSENQESKIVRLNNKNLPQTKHLFSIVNSQNNERMFFADKVILVEGLSDQLFFEAAFRRLGIYEESIRTYEIIQVGGKYFFGPYEEVLQACRVPYALISDLDYINEFGPPELRGLFKINDSGIAKDVIKNANSKDGQSLVQRLSEAIDSGNLEDLRILWSYIKARKRKLRADLSQTENEALNQFIETQRSRNVFLLSEGDLESYLPIGYRSKDIEKLIPFLESDFWGSLSETARNEITTIVDLVKKL